MTRPLVRRAIAAGSALLVGAALALTAALPASADSDIVDTPTFTWSQVEDDALYIGDAASRYDDFRGTGLTFDQGFTADAFDGFLFSIHAYYAVLDAPVALTPVSASWVDGGLSTIRSHGYVDFGNGRELNVDVTLEIQGNYARWTFAGSNLPGARLEVSGDLGSDTSTVVVPVDATSFVTHDLYGSDPIIGYQVSGAGAAIEAASGDEDITVRFDAPGTSSLVVALQDYSPCARDAAIAEMTARAPALASTFGATIDPPTDTCITVAAPAAFVAGATTDQTLDVTIDAALEPALAGFLQNPDFRFTAVGLPSGLTLDLDVDARTLHLAGTAVPGSYPVTLLFHGDNGTVRWLPFSADISVQVDPAAAPELAATGADDTNASLGAVVLVVLGVIALAFARRARARA